ncbi:MAG: ribose 5-phosphate isomerase B [Clostridiales Family XIII bacterium]|jgi:ribose 5-phosphate isomerase B|nr:ribose 5-phosphate isomerase B [Clostridiales Family XIII bacterium]
MKIALASDHGGFELKNGLRDYLSDEGYEVVDLGTESGESVDYPVYGKKCAEYVVSGQADKGIVVCGTGIGIGIAANKVHGARCAVVASETHAFFAKNHNDANLIALGERTTELEDAKLYVDTWLQTKFDGGERHARRVKLLDDM